MFERWARSPRLKRYARSYWRVEGWFKAKSVVIWDAWLELQEASGIRGHFLEIGVYKGKSAFLSTLFSRPDELCFFLDLRLDPDFRHRMEDLKPEGARFLEMRSEDLRAVLDEHVPGRGSFRWVHVDGGHTADAVVNDLHVADALLSGDGMVVVDDFLSSSFPQVSEGLFRFLREHPDRLSLLLSGFNKGYLVRPGAWDAYERFVREGLPAHLRSRRFSDFTLMTPRRKGVLMGTAGYGITGRIGNQDFADGM